MHRNEDFSVTFIRGTLDVVTEGVDFSKFICSVQKTIEINNP